MFDKINSVLIYMIGLLLVLMITIAACIVEVLLGSPLMCMFQVLIGTSLIMYLVYCIEIEVNKQ